jgi:hypothetical protein
MALAFAPASPIRSGRMAKGPRSARITTDKHDYARELTEAPRSLATRASKGLRVPTALGAACGLRDNHPKLPRTPAPLDDSGKPRSRPQGGYQHAVVRRRDCGATTGPR